MAEGLSDDTADGAGLPSPGDAPDGGLSAFTLFVVVVVVVDIFED